MAVRICLPALEQFLEIHGCRAYADQVLEVLLNHSLSEISGWQVAELVKSLVSRLQLMADDLHRYEELFEENALDGWVFSEIDDFAEYVEIGVRHEHAVVFVALSQALKGKFGIPMVVDEERTERERTELKLDSSALSEADRIAAETGRGGVYGQLVVLGYKEYRVEGSTWHPVGARNDKFELLRRAEANGIKKGSVYLSDGRRHVRWALASHTVTMSVASHNANGRRVVQQVKK